MGPAKNAEELAVPSTSEFGRPFAPDSVVMVSGSLMSEFVKS